MSAKSPGPNDHFLTVYRRKFRAWRGSRPFWAGLLTMLGGVPIAYLPYGNIKLGNLTLALATTAGAGSLIIGVLLMVLGLTMWFQVHTRVFAGVAAILLALVSLVVSNIGGFLVGFLLALIGGALGIAWGEPGSVPAKGAKGAKAAKGRTEKESEPAVAGAPNGVDGASANDDLSATSPVDGTNGRHRAG
ncbi:MULTISPECIES: DUF6114 domain-containing protein [Streptomyces]|uniref:Integral membrane protein n=1 Tax=Streptomyces venezuelae TaxID=54571 RepID=A0A5P2CNM5_STRVZ|nr:DUF6114 domain-containing protein [Streptomyces venezuelae]QES43910.1 hypothetical protein DEJ49_25565 [Streptomyces venezuelae]